MCYHLTCYLSLFSYLNAVVRIYRERVLSLDGAIEIPELRITDSNRTVSFRHNNGAVIARTSQPEVGWLFWRSKEDEKMIQAIISACHASATDSPPRKSHSRKNDKRSFIDPLFSQVKLAPIASSFSTHAAMRPPLPIAPKAVASNIRLTTPIAMFNS